MPDALVEWFLDAERSSRDLAMQLRFFERHAREQGFGPGDATPAFCVSG